MLIRIFLGVFLLALSMVLPAQSPRIILDTDANNELDDQHAIAYLLFNTHVFDIVGITVNATYNGGALEHHLQEARRIVSLCGYGNSIPVIGGASRDFKDIVPHIDDRSFDGKPAVDFIIDAAYQEGPGKLVVVPIGSLTNVALALQKDPAIASRIRVIWLGSNWPGPGEYNLVNDTTAINSVIDNRQLELEICTVRYGEDSGTAAVSVSVQEIRERMKTLGPHLKEPVRGRHGGSFHNFGDYSVELFEKIGDSHRSLFDVCALAVIKDPRWARPLKVPAPRLAGDSWIPRPQNTHHIIFWEHFDKEAILQDFFRSMEHPRTFMKN